jgi:hypothetical protein
MHIFLQPAVVDSIGLQRAQQEVNRGGTEPHRVLLLKKKCGC